MKKILPILIVGILILCALGASASNIKSNNIQGEIEKNNNLDRGTHTVLAELGTATDCPYCPSHELYIFQVQGDYEVVELPCSHYAWNYGYNQAIKDRLHELGITGFPTSYWDGGYRSVVGGQSSVANLQNAYNACASRTVADVDLELTMYWLGNAEIQIDINVINNDSSTYNGHLHVDILEIVSRWHGYDGLPYKNALLDCPINENINVESGATWSDSITWNGNDHGYGDITKNNIKGVATVFTQSTKYADDTIAALPLGNPPPPNNPPGKPTITGPSNGKNGVDLTYTVNAVDPDGDNVNYWFDWGDGTNSGWVGPYPSGVSESANHMWSTKASYQIKVKAKDINGAESDWATFDVVIPRNIIISNIYLLSFLQAHLNMFPILQKLLQRLG